MSSVSNVILAYGMISPEDQTGPLNAINAACEQGRVVHVEDPKLPPDWFCNGKALEVNIAIGAFNYLNLDQWLANMRAIDFAAFECSFVQLMVMGQHDEGFQIFDVWRDVDSFPPEPFEVQPMSQHTPEER